MRYYLEADEVGSNNLAGHGETSDPRQHLPADTEPPEDEARWRRSGKGRRAFRGLRRELSEDELSNTGTLRMILDQHDQLVEENDDLRRVRERFHACNREAAVLRERLKKSNAHDIVLGATLAGGSLVLGYLPSLWSTQPTGLIALVVGTTLVVGSVVARLVLR